MFDYPYINHVLYPRGAGGKFLINCLSLNDKAVFQDKKLAQDQLDKNFTVDDKVQYINKHLEIAKQTKVWNDLLLGDNELFTMKSESYTDTFPEYVRRKLKTPVIKNCMTNKLHLFTVTHNFIWMKYKLKIWTNGKLIVFKNHKNFINNRDYENKVIDFWNIIKAEDWPSAPNNLSQYNQLPKSIKNELSSNFDDKIYDYLSDREEFDELWHRYLQELSKTVDLFEFDVDYAYNNSHNFYKIYVEVCNYINLPIADRSIIIEYYNKWKETILSVN